MEQTTKDEIMKIVHKYVPDVIESVDDYDWQLDESCGCYSEYTTESCCLKIGLISPTVAKNDYKLMQRIEHAIRKWADGGGVSWTGCDCCGNNLWVDVRLYNVQQTR